jgi:ABC-type Zn uptake system ZnuABC Zn-binding protein ZnuA
MRVPRKVLVGVVLAAVAGMGLSLGGCSKHEAVWPEGKGKRVLVSFAPLYCFTKKVAGDDARVACLLTTQGPHEHGEPTKEDALKVRDADLFLLNGLGLEPKDFAERLQNNASNPKLRIVYVGEALPKELKEKADEDEKEKGHHHEGGWDPHVWLGIEQAKKMVEIIRDELSTLDPEHKDGFHKRAAAFNAELDKLHEDGKKALKDKKNRKLVTQHESLDYFAKSFGLDIVGPIETKAGSEPTPQEMKKLVELCKEKNVKVIAFEPQYPEAAAKTLADELKNRGVADVKTIQLDPLETAPLDELNAANGADYYLTQMRKNLDNLVKALP